MKLGQRLYKLRKERSLTLDDISRKTGVGKATLSRIENGITNGTINTNMKICSALGVEFKQLYEDVELPKELVPTEEKQESIIYNNRKYDILMAQEVTKKKVLVIVCSPT